MKYDKMEARETSNCPLAQLFLKQVTLKPQAPALISDDKVVSFSDLYKQANALKEAFTHESAGEELIIGIACTSTEAEICSVLATLLADACFVPLDEQLPAARLADVIEDAHPSVIVVSGQTAEVPAPRSLLRHSSKLSAVFLEVDDSGRPQDGGVPGAARVDGGGRARNLPTTWQEFTGLIESSKGEILDAIAHTEVASVHSQRPGSKVKQSSQEAGSSACLLREIDADNGGVHAVDQADEDDLLYIMYTSGTTGKAKGVRGTRAGAMNRLRFGWSEFPFRDASELVARRTPSCFVDFVAEVLSPLLAGVPIYIPPRGAASDPLRLVPAMTKSHATRVTLTPSLLSSLLRTAESRPGPLLPDLHTCFVSGEALHRDLAVRFRRQAASGAQLVNLYGSTEVAGDATYCTLDDILEPSWGRARSPADATDVVDEGVLIGRPLPGTYVSIVDSNLRAVDAGHPGELVVGGSGVARGYHRRPSETAEKFMVSQGHGRKLNGGRGVCIPGIPHGERMVRMGDRVVQPSADGPLFWLGRLDSEVKIRGVRVSLDEVERLMCSAGKLPAGASAAVWDPGKARESPATAVSARESSTIADAPDRGRLLGFVTQEGMRAAGHTLSSLRRVLGQEMSTAQLPALLLPVSRAFLLTPTGKVDKGALLREFSLRGSGPPERLSETVVADDRVAMQGHSPAGEGPCPGQRSYAAAKAAIARALNEVLPDASEQTAAWLTGVRPEALDPPEPACGPALTFAELGGTSLLAVEAAWLSTCFFIRDNSSPGAELTLPQNLLDAADFLQGTLECAARTLGSRTIPATVAGGPAAPTVVSPNVPEVPSSGTESCASASDLPVAVIPGAIDHTRELPRLSVARGIKRRLGDEDGAGAQIFRLEERSEVIAIGRAGVGLIRSPGCPRFARESSEKGKEIGPWAGVEAESVHFRRSWSSGMKKCIDGTPLLVISGSAGVQHSEGGEDMVVAEANHPGAGSASRAHAVENYRASLPSPVPGDANAEFRQGSVYIGSHSGEFQALNLETGRLRWSITLGDRIESGACCSSDGSLILIGCHDRRLYALDRDTGAVVWTFETRDVIKCTPVCVPAARRSASCNDPGSRGERAPVGIPAADAVLCGSHDGVLRCLSLADGELVWQLDCGGALYASPAHDTNARVVYAATTKGRFLAVARTSAAPPDEEDDADEGLGTVIPEPHLKTGNASERRKPGGPFVLWSHHLPGPCFSTPAVSSATGIIVLGCVDGALYCFSPEGERLWAHRQGRKPVFSSPCLMPWLESGVCDSGIGKKDTDLKVVWGCHDGKLRCGAGTRVCWETDIGKGHPVFSSPFGASVECAGCAQPLPLVFACATPGLIVAARLSDGIVAGETQLPGEVFSSPVVIRRRLVVGCRDDKVYAMDIFAVCSRCTARREH